MRHLTMRHVTRIGIAALLLAFTAAAAAASPAAQTRPAGGAAFEKVVLRDVQGLFGGQDLWLSAEGQLTVQVVRPARNISPCMRYSRRLEANELARIGSLLAEHKFQEIQIKERSGVPDEARPAITVRSADGNERTVQKWANDKQAGFDAIYKELLALVKTAAQGKAEYAGPYDRGWAPKASDSQPAAAVRSVVPGRMVCCEACKARLDLANGIKKCTGCGGVCNVAHTMCTKCAKNAGVCEVCGKAMAPPAIQPTTSPAGKIDPNRSAVFTSGKWRYEYEAARPGRDTVIAPRGRLSYDGTDLSRVRDANDFGPQINDYYETPWGRLYHHGYSATAKMPSGWIPEPREKSRREGRALSDPGGHGVAVATPQDLVVGETSDGKTVVAAVGQKIVIRVPSEGPGPKPPPQWTAKLEGESLRQEGEIRLRGRGPIAVPGRPGPVAVQQGGPMVAEGVFTTVKPGKTKITLEARPFRQPDAAPTKTFTFTVDVQAATTTAPAAKPSEAKVKEIAPVAVTQP